MFHQYFKNANLPAIVFFMFCLSAFLPAQTGVETPVSPVNKISSRYSKCFINEGNAVISQARFNEITRGNCSELTARLNVDFEKHTLVTYRVGGDCFVRAKSAVTRSSDAEKKFTVHLTNIWGGCRAAGSIRGWIVLDKIPAGYNVEFSETRVDDLKGNIPGDNGFDSFLPKQSDLPKNTELLPTREADLKGCIQMYIQRSFVIKDKTAFENAVRKDASRAFCLKSFENFDFEKYSLLGIDINSGYCRRPVGLEFQTLKDRFDNKYILKIRFDDPRGAVCRALSQFDLWVLVPKIPDGFDVNFEIEPKQRRDSN
jgi:hypothetical protein